MKKMVLVALFLLFPWVVYAADGSLTFAPPATDYSVIFLGNLFGIVDGVLRGTGSQIMGVMFGVFNSAVLALGGMIIMYTLIVSTMNTAHEGQMLGQKWSSIWIPVRSTLGLALLIPKASGYCLMQIFVMWVVVQGVGAADKIWEAALSYLNRGGVIIQTQLKNPAADFLSEKNAAIPTAAANILSGQVCMLGLQKQLERQRQTYLNAKQNNSGPCVNPIGVMKDFCNTVVPDFINSVNVVIIQNKNKSADKFSVNMPNFDSGSYVVLNGICGRIEWNKFEPNLKNQDNRLALEANKLLLSAEPEKHLFTNTFKEKDPADELDKRLSSSEFETINASRAIAIQQMYLDLSSVAQIIINNDPQIVVPMGGVSSSDYSKIAKQEFGVPYTKNGALCQQYSDICMMWGSSTMGSAGGILFNGTEFQGAMNNYNSIMFPALNLIKQAKNNEQAGQARAFIAQANRQGWIMAGSYFFDLVNLQGNAAENADLQDENTGLDRSVFDPSLMSSPFKEDGCQGPYTALCEWFQQSRDKVSEVSSLIDGASVTPALVKPDMKPNADRKFTFSLAASTVYGFLNNSMMMRLPGQPGLAPLKFASMVNLHVDATSSSLQVREFPCGPIYLPFNLKICLTEHLGNIFYNGLFVMMINLLMVVTTTVINKVLFFIIILPINGMASTFAQTVQIMSTPGINPVVALAKMGVFYINFSANFWINLLILTAVNTFIPFLGSLVQVLIFLAMPLFFAWTGIMFISGFLFAYYVPIIPYMIFTFGSIAWLMAVIEAMVAAPLVALGITHPEGHDAFGKGEAAIMILVNVFLRPAMMIIGYISAIALCYVGVWVLNAGFDHAISFISGGEISGTSTSKGYSDWAGIYAYFFSILTYTMLYLIIVQRAFSMITYLPDKVLRWIGGAPEGIGEQAAQWGDELKQSNKETANVTKDAQGQTAKQLGGQAEKLVGKAKGGIESAVTGGGDVTAGGTD